MRRVHAAWKKLGVLIPVSVSLAALVVPWPAQAGGVRVSIGFELPVPVAVTPAPVVVAPAPVIVQRPPVVIHQPPPVIVHQAPVVVQRPPVVITEPWVVPTHSVYRHHLPPGLAKKYYGHRHHWGHGQTFFRHGKHRHHHDD